MSEELKFCPFCKSSQLEVVKIDMKDPGRDLIKCRHCRGQVMRYHWDTRHITKADAESYCRENRLVMVTEETINKMEDLYGILDGTHKRLKHETEDILGGIIDDIAAYRDQAI